MIRRAAFLSGVLGLVATQPAHAQSGYMIGAGLTGKWGSTLKGFDKDQRPPYYYEENVLLTISANGNIQLERTRRELKSKASETLLLNGVWTSPAQGILRLTFSDNLGEIPGLWHYAIRGNEMIVVDDSTGIQRKYYRVQTAIY